MSLCYAKKTTRILNYLCYRNRKQCHQRVLNKIRKIYFQKHRRGGRKIKIIWVIYNKAKHTNILVGKNVLSNHKIESGDACFTYLEILDVVFSFCYKPLILDQIKQRNAYLLAPGIWACFEYGMFFVYVTNFHAIFLLHFILTHVIG